MTYTASGQSKGITMQYEENMGTKSTNMETPSGSVNDAVERMTVALDGLDNSVNNTCSTFESVIRQECPSPESVPEENSICKLADELRQMSLRIEGFAIVLDGLNDRCEL